METSKMIVITSRALWWKCLVALCLLISNTAHASQSGLIENESKQYNSIENLIQSSNLISLRKALTKDKQLVKRALLVSLNKKLNNANALNSFLNNISALDSNTGSYLQTARVFIQLLGSDYIKGIVRPDSEILESIVRQSALLFTLPIADNSNNYVFNNLLSEPSFLAFLKEKKSDFFMEFRKTNGNDISGSLNLLKELDLAHSTSDVQAEINKLMFQIAKSSNAHRNIFQKQFMQVVERVSASIEEQKIRSSTSNALAAFLIDRMEEDNQVEATDIFLKLKQSFPEYRGLSLFEKYFVTTKNSKKKLKANNKAKESQSFLKNTKNANAPTHSSFPFGLLFIAIFSVAGFVVYRSRQNITESYSPISGKIETPKFEELADFDEQLGLVN